MSKNNESKRFPSSKPPYPPLFNPLVNQPPSTPFGLPHPQANVPPTPSYPNGWPNTNGPTPLQPPSFAPDIPTPPNPDSGHPHPTPNSFNR